MEPKKCAMGLLLKEISLRRGKEVIPWSQKKHVVGLLKEDLSGEALRRDRELYEN